MDDLNKPDRKSYKVVYSIVDRGQNKKPHWMRIGIAFVNSDASLNVKLDGLPCNGQLHIRDQSEAPWERSQPALDFAAAGDRP